MAKTIGTLVIDLVGQTAQFQTDMRNAATKFNRSLSDMERRAQGFQNVIRTAFAGYGASIVSREVIQTISTFEQSMSRVQAISRASASEFELLKKKARELGAETNFTATQVAQGMAFLAQSGQQPAQILETIRSSLLTAGAGELELAESADIATGMLAAFSLKADQAGRVADVLALSAASTNTDIHLMAEAMKYAGSTGNQFKQSLETTAAAIGVLANHMQKGEMGGAALRNIFIELSQKTGPLKKYLKDVSLEGDGLAAVLLKLKNSAITPAEVFAAFDKRGGVAALNLIKSAEAVKQFEDAFLHAGGSVEQMYATMQDNIAGAWERVKSAGQEMILQWGERGLGGALRETLELVYKNFSAFQTGIEATIGLLIGAGGLVVAIKIATRSVQLLTAAAANPWMLGATILSTAIAEWFIFRDTAEKTAKAIDDVSASSKKLIEQYARLSSATETGWKEQAELNRVASEIQKLFPQANIQWDQYGNAIRGSAGEVQALRDQLKALSKDMMISNVYPQFIGKQAEVASFASAIQEQEAEYQKLTEAVAAYQKTIQAGGTEGNAAAAAQKIYPVPRTQILGPSGIPYETGADDILKELERRQIAVRNQLNLTRQDFHKALDDAQKYHDQIDNLRKTGEMPTPEAVTLATSEAIDPTGGAAGTEASTKAADYLKKLLDMQADYQNKRYLNTLDGVQKEIEAARLEGEQKLYETYAAAQEIISAEETTAVERAQIQTQLGETLRSIQEETNTRIAALVAKENEEQAKAAADAAKKIADEQKKLADSLNQSHSAMLSAYGSLASGINQKSVYAFEIEKMLLADRVREFQSTMDSRLEILKQAGADEKQILEERAQFERYLDQYQLEEFKKIQQERLLALGEFADGARVYFQRLQDDQYSMGQAGFDMMNRVHQGLETSLGDSFFAAMTGRFSSLKDVVLSFGQSIVQAFADIAAKILAQKIMMSLFEKTMGAATTATTIAEATTAAAAWAPAAAAASLATLGANAGPAAAAISSTYALTSGLSLMGLAEGGIVTRPTLIAAGEGGSHEAVIPFNDRGRDILRQALQPKDSTAGRTVIRQEIHLHNPTFMDQSVLAASMRTIAVQAFADDYMSDGVTRSIVRRAD